MNIINFNKDKCMGVCSLCNNTDELRPYGNNFTLICFECGMKNKEQTKQNMKLFLEQNSKNNNLTIINYI